jgi:hypothetical protein
MKWLFRWCFQLMLGDRLMFGGDSESVSNPITKNTDARVVGGENSSNASVNDNQGVVSITTTDHGAVDGSLRLALAGVEGANKLATQTVAANGSLLSGALKMAGDQNQAFTSAVENIKTSDVRVLVIAGLAVVGLVGFQFLKKAA